MDHLLTSNIIQRVLHVSCRDKAGTAFTVENEIDGGSFLFLPNMYFLKSNPKIQLEFSMIINGRVSM